MQITFTLCLPRDELSVPVVRQIVAQSLGVLGVTPASVSDIEVALTEACSNVLRHSGGDDVYEVLVGLDDAQAVIEVVDTGRGFDAAGLGHTDAVPSAERGRGIQLMRALVDSVHFVQREEKGTVVHLEKRLSWAEDAPIGRLAGARREKAGSPRR